MKVEANVPGSNTVFTPRKKVAVVFGGCGANDGTEITEGAALLITLGQAGHDVAVFAPNRNQVDNVNHLNGESDSSPRNLMQEAARIARGNISPLTELNADNFDAICFAGGYGAAKNLCNYFFTGKDANLEADVKEALLPFLKGSKPAAALCISPVLLALGAREMGWKNAEITLSGDDSADVISHVQSWGCTHVEARVNEAVVDSAHKLVSSPAYMYGNATSAEVFASAQALVTGLNTLFTNT